MELEEFAEECQYKTSVAESRMDELQHEADMLAAQLQNAWNIAYQTQAAPAQAPQQAGLPVTAEIPMIAEAPAASAEPVFPGQSMPFDHTLNLSDDYPDDDTTEEIPAASRSDLTVSSGAPDVTAEQADHLQVEPDTAPAPRATFAPVQEAHDVDHVYNFIKPNPYVSSEYNPLDRLTWRELETVYSMGVLSIKDFAKHIPAAPPPTPPVFARTKEQPATPAPPPAANLPTNPPANPTASPPPPQNNAPAKPNTPPPKPVVKAEAKGPAKPKAASKGGWASMSDTMMGLPQLKPEELVALSVAKQEERKDEQQSVEYGDQAYGQDLYEQVPTAEEQQPEQYAQQYDMDGQPVEYTQDPYSQQYAQGQDPYAQQYAQGQTDQYAYQQYMQGQPDQYAQQSYGQGQAAPYAQEQYGQGQSDPYAQQQYVQGQQDPYAQQQYAQDQSDQYGQQPDQYGQQPYIQGQAEQYDQYPEQPDQYDSQYAQPFEGHQHPEEEQATEMPLIDFEQADMFEDLEDLEELGQIDIPNDPISPQSLDSLTADQPVAEVPPKEKVSGEELRDLIKSRIAQAKSNPAGDFLGSDDELEVHQTAAAGAAGPKPSSLASKFIGGKGRAQGEPAAPQAPAPDPANLLVQTKHVPPDIRKFCQYLGLRPQELTRELILKEWKRQMSEVHPDLGGDHDLAIDLNLAKERLLKWLDENEPKLLKKFGGGGGGGKEMSSRFTGRGKQDKS